MKKKKPGKIPKWHWKPEPFNVLVASLMMWSRWYDSMTLISVRQACHTLPLRWNLPAKRPWLCKSRGLSTLLMPSMLPSAICLKVQGFWLFCSISACFCCRVARLSLLITWNNIFHINSNQWRIQRIAKRESKRDETDFCVFCALGTID